MVLTQVVSVREHVIHDLLSSGIDSLKKISRVGDIESRKSSPCGLYPQKISVRFARLYPFFGFRGGRARVTLTNKSIWCNLTNHEMYHVFTDGSFITELQHSELSRVGT